MRIKRTDKNFTAKKKADRQIHYAGQGKKYTESTVNLSAREKQDALRHSGHSGGKVQGQTYRNPDGGGGEAFAVPGNIHVKQLRHLEDQKPAFQDSHFPVDGQSSQHKAWHQVQYQVQPPRPSAFHENTIKTKETVIHRKQEAPDINRHTGTVIFKGKHFSAKEIQRKQPARSLKIRHGSRAAELRNTRPAGDIPVKDAGEVNPVSPFAQSFEDKRERQISGYKKEKYLRFQKQERMGRNVYAGSDTARKSDTGSKAGTWKTEEKYKPELYLSQLHQTGEPALSEIKSNLINQQKKDTSHLRTRASGDSIRQRGKGISAQRKQGKAGIKDTDTGKDSRKSRNTKENKKHGNDRKNTKRDTGSKSGAERRRKRAATLRLLSYARDKFSQEEQKDSLLKVAKDLLLGKAKAAAMGTLLSIGVSLLPVLIPAFIITIVITLLFNSPFSILLPKLTDGPGGGGACGIHGGFPGDSAGRACRPREQ